MAYNAVTSLPSPPPTCAFHPAQAAWACYSSNPRDVPTPGPLRWWSPSRWNSLLSLLPSTHIRARCPVPSCHSSRPSLCFTVPVTLTRCTVCACRSSVLPHPLERRLHEGSGCHPSCSPLYPDACNTARPSRHLKTLVNEQINLSPPHYSPAHMPHTHAVLGNWQSPGTRR